MGKVTCYYCGKEIYRKHGKIFETHGNWNKWICNTGYCEEAIRQERRENELFSSMKNIPLVPNICSRGVPNEMPGIFAPGNEYQDRATAVAMNMAKK